MEDTRKSKLGKRSRWTSSKNDTPNSRNRSESPKPKKKRDLKEINKEQSDKSDMEQSSIKNSDKGTNFDEFPELKENTIKGLCDRGITWLFPIQISTFRYIYDGDDIIARDLTGSGKTLAFCLPLVEKYRKLGYFSSESREHKRKLLAIILAPTRELALQVAKELKALKHNESEYKVITVYGGVSIDEQTRELRSGVEFFVGTTGRVLDHIERGNIDFSTIKAVWLDEADQMLNMGFQEDVEKIMTSITREAKEKPQCMLFSATIPPWVKDVARKYLSQDYRFVDLVKDLKNKTSQTVQHLAINWPYQNRTNTLADILLCYGGLHGKTIVFAQTKVDANSVMLADKVTHDVEVLHGDIAQNQREVTLKRFREGKFNVLVATDVASRGLDIPNVDLVIQLEPPKDVETYIHRSGRTARAGNSGTWITFYTKKQQGLINLIETKAGIKLKKIGAPQPEDIIRSSAKEAIKGFEKVDEEVLKLFEETAQQLIDSKGALKAVSLALAYISGTTKTIKKRSLLTGEEHFVTYDLQTNEEFRGVSYVWGILRRLLPQNIVDAIRGMRMYNSRKGAVFDVPEEHSSTVQDLFQNEKESRRSMSYNIEIAKELPELFETEPLPMEPRRGGFGGRSSGPGFRREGGYEPRGRPGGFGGNDMPRDFGGGRFGSRPSGGYGGGHGGSGYNSNNSFGGNSGYTSRLRNGGHSDSRQNGYSNHGDNRDSYKRDYR